LAVLDTKEKPRRGVSNISGWQQRIEMEKHENVESTVGSNVYKLKTTDIWKAPLVTLDINGK
jgi:hypothetical protein